MRLSKSIGRLGLGAAFIVAAVNLRHGEVSAQTDMPGMTPTATPSPSLAAESTASPTPTPTPADSAAAQQDMESMPGMAPAKKDMSGMPGMEPMDQSKKKGMGTMPGMSNGTSTPQRMSAPGVLVLGPPQKWVPRRGDNRATELLARPILEQNLNQLPPPVEDSKLHSFLLFDLLEYRFNSSGLDMLVWDFVGWFGGDYNRLWLKTEGRQKLSGGNRGEGDLQLLYGRLIAPFWDFQIGVRGKQNLGAGFAGNSRTYAVIGLQGLAPGNFDFEPALYISERGEVSAELTVSADLYLTQRLVLQPRFQGEVSIQGDEKFGTGSGVTEIDLGLRLRYEIRREFAPYIGVSWLRNFGETASIARSEGETFDTFALVAGLRLWW